ncbi:hypothetical protein [Neobacillus muris]|nr:hypothetical protein [Neobacillus muris]
MKGRRKTPPRIPVEEFSVEYGDVNGIPLHETKSARTNKRAKTKRG